MVIFLPVSLFALTLGSCISATSSSTISQYSTYTLKHFGVYFSFEYPSGYKEVNTNIRDNPVFPIGIRFAQAHGIFGLLSVDPVFAVNIDSPLTEHELDPKSAANIAGGHTPDRELERASIPIAGTTGELVAYYSDDFQNTSSVTRKVFFDVNGVLWSISVYSSTAKIDEARLDFEHIIESFKVGQ